MQSLNYQNHRIQPLYAAYFWLASSATPPPAPHSSLPLPPHCAPQPPPHSAAALWAASDSALLLTLYSTGWYHTLTSPCSLTFALIQHGGTTISSFPPFVCISSYSHHFTHKHPLSLTLTLTLTNPLCHPPPHSQQSDVLVGVHGAQLYNALFMPQHKALVEIRTHGFWGVSGWGWSGGKWVKTGG